MIFRVMTVAGSDSGGGAGIQADVKTITCLGAFATTAITAVTSQNSVGVDGIVPLDPSFVSKQMDSILRDIGTDSAKTGMLQSGSIIKEVSSTFRKFKVDKIVVDPVMVSKTGARLLRDDSINELQSSLLAIAELVTPNIPEAEILSGMKIRDVQEMKIAAEKIYNKSGCSVLMKGGHLENSQKSTDFLLHNGKYSEYSSLRIETKNTHGTGDTLSSAIATYRAMGKSMEESVKLAKEYLQGAIENSFPMGKGYGSLCHSWRMR
ncbi:MAG: bifunctional hydroxymethylpyrimidine kinase/phosphomethylpyrimidine kinase [Candidatus Thermoplasmatota archaeon]|jgi:hydroxymethylpyrimidine/phosphomethylpyrimidine kinase|nr:bifunctional hydroxymethylpyrimidine kinase/phosphomethylpyrimidine kinase [Candidatus Thermoplasmatota archaeon]MCL5987593.1 bifunctional hydroxymethylpyrimidine kinase/phosphomethylpyrimidine kinase [Candidatus Thermoplasmatota archaeon]